MLAEGIVGLIEMYKNTKKSLECGLKWLPGNIYAKSKIEVMDMIIQDLEELQNNMINGDTNSDKNNKTFFII